MHNSPPPEPQGDQGSFTLPLLQPWRAYARAHASARPKPSGKQPVPVGLLSALLIPAMTARWLSLWEPAAVLAGLRHLHIMENCKGKLDPALPLRVEVGLGKGAQLLAGCTQEGHKVGSVTWVWKLEQNVRF